MKILEDELCDWKAFKFQKYESDIEKLGLPEWSVGKAVQLYIDKKNFMRHEIMGGRKYIKEYRLVERHLENLFFFAFEEIKAHLRNAFCNFGQLELIS